MKVPKQGGHRKPSSAAKHAPDGYEHMKKCPTCKGSGSIPISSAHEMAIKRV